MILPVRFVAALALALTAPLPAQTNNPFPDPIARSTFVVDVVDFATIPTNVAGTPRISVLTVAPDGRIFANDQKGPLYLISADGSAVTLYLDLRSVQGVALQANSEQGFQSFAFHPQFLTVGTPGFGKFYTAHTSSNLVPAPDYAAGQGGDAGDHVVLEWTTSDPAASTFVAADPAAPFREVLRISGPFGNHTMGLIAFNSTALPGSPEYGKLYVAMGDGGSGGDPFDLAGNPANPYGAILRIDPLGTNGSRGRYGIPADNPFVGGNSGALGEVFAYGLRNPQRFSWDSSNSRMFIADIGQGAIEEVNVGLPGANYGWNDREGSFEFLGGGVGTNLRSDTATTGFTYPIAEYDHSEGNAVAVGPVERSGRIPQLQGKLLFSDFPRGRLFYLDADTLPTGGPSGITELRLRYQGEERSFQAIVNTINPDATRTDLRFGTDNLGRIFLLNKQDGVIRVVGSAENPTDPPVEPPSVPTDPPTVRVDGPKRQTTTRPRVALRGIASAGTVRIEARNTRARADFRSIRGTDSWTYRARLRPGRNVLLVRAVDADGRTSIVSRSVVIRR